MGKWDRSPLGVTVERLVGHCEEQAVREHGAAYNKSRLPFSRAPSLQEHPVLLKPVGIQSLVLEVEIRIRMKLVGAPARHSVSYETRSSSVLRRKVVGGNPVFLDCFGRDRSQWAGVQIVVVLQAIEQKIG